MLICQTQMIQVKAILEYFFKFLVEFWWNLKTGGGEGVVYL